MDAKKMNGKWKRDPSSVTGFEETLTKLGISEEIRRTYKDAVWTIKYNVLSSNQLEIETIVEGMFDDKPHVMTVTLGESYDTVFMDGTKAKGVVTLEGDVLVEKMNDTLMAKDKIVTTKRTFNGKQMIEAMIEPGNGKLVTKYNLVE